MIAKNEIQIIVFPLLISVLWPAKSYLKFWENEYLLAEIWISMCKVKYLARKHKE